MEKDKRVEEIREAISLLGWVAVQERLRTPEDRAIFDKLSDNFRTRSKAKDAKVLKQHHIAF